MKQIIFSMSLTLLSFSALAGSQPQTPVVNAGNCIALSYNPFTISWNDKSECRDYINQGYAKGVGFSGEVSYGKNYQSTNWNTFVGHISPSEARCHQSGSALQFRLVVDVADVHAVAVTCGGAITQHVSSACVPFL